MRPRLRKEDVRFLAFEGGGGKGFAFLGALQALETDLNILRFERGRLVGQIEGLTGSSAGAIMALALSIGLDTARVENLMTGGTFEQFRDPATPAARPQIGVLSGCAVDEDLASVTDLRSMYGMLQRMTREAHHKTQQAISGISRLVGRAGSLPVPGAELSSRMAQLVLEYMANRLQDTVDLLLDATALQRGLLRQVAETEANVAMYRLRLLHRWGLFHGGAARLLFDQLITEQLQIIERQEPGLRSRLCEGNERLERGKEFQNVTFKTHYLAFQRKLAVTGVNLRTGKSEIFSCDTTPHMCVADAVRISMSVPLYFMPVPIHSNPDQPRSVLDPLRGRMRIDTLPIYPGEGEMAIPLNSLVGYWVDGGMFNNIPISAFDYIEPHKTLGIRLEVDEPTELFDPAQNRDGSLGILLYRLAWLALLGSGEGHISHSWQTVMQTVSLPTYGLSLLSFAVDDRTLRRVKAIARGLTRNYFRP